jgi:hypothetical protein
VEPPRGSHRSNHPLTSRRLMEAGDVQKGLSLNIARSINDPSLVIPQASLIAVIVVVK